MSAPVSSPGKIEAVGSNGKRSDFLNHLFIIALLAISLLPFYMMMQISLKDNHLFLANTWLPNAPGTWGGKTIFSPSNSSCRMWRIPSLSPSPPPPPVSPWPCSALIFSPGTKCRSAISFGRHFCS